MKKHIAISFALLLSAGSLFAAEDNTPPAPPAAPAADVPAKPVDPKDSEIAALKAQIASLQAIIQALVQQRERILNVEAQATAQSAK